MFVYIWRVDMMHFLVTEVMVKADEIYNMLIDPG